MSIKAVAWALEQDTQSQSDKLVLIGLANFAGDDDESYPSRRRLASIAICSLDSVDRAVKRLEADGLITKRARVHEKGGTAANGYKLMLSTVHQQDIQNGGGGPQFAAGGSRIAVRLREPHSYAAEGAATVRPPKEPSQEPLHEPIAPRGAARVQKHPSVGSGGAHAPKAGPVPLGEGRGLPIARQGGSPKADLVRRAEGFGLPTAELLAATRKAAPDNPHAYFWTLCVSDLAKRLPRCSRELLSAAMSGKREAFTVVTLALIEGAVA